MSHAHSGSGIREGRRVEVAYATARRQTVIDVTIPQGATLGDAIRLSGILERFPELDLARNSVGVFGVIKSLTDPVQEGDRVEIYRPLVADPKETRRRRAGR